MFLPSPYGMVWKGRKEKRRKHFDRKKIEVIYLDRRKNHEEVFARREKYRLGRISKKFHEKLKL